MASSAGGKNSKETETVCLRDMKFLCRASWLRESAANLAQWAERVNANS